MKLLLVIKLFVMTNISVVQASPHTVFIYHIMFFLSGLLAEYVSIQFVNRNISK